MRTKVCKAKYDENGEWTCHLSNSIIGVHLEIAECEPHPEFDDENIIRFNMWITFNSDGIWHPITEHREYEPAMLPFWDVRQRLVNSGMYFEDVDYALEELLNEHEASHGCAPKQ